MDNLLRSQLVELAYFFLAGFEICFVFDIFRAQRRAIKTSDGITYVQDVLFWLIAGLILMHTIISYTNGELRAYMIIGLIGGVAFYLVFVSKWVIKLALYLLNIVKKLLSIFAFPIKKINKFIKKTGKTNKM